MGLTGVSVNDERSAACRNQRSIGPDRPRRVTTLRNMQTAERNYVQCDLIESPPASGHRERIGFAVLVAAVFLVTITLVVMCLNGAVTGLP